MASSDFAPDATMPVPAPDGLGSSGTALWFGIANDYELRSDELRILEDACREADLIDALADRLEHEDLLITGSQGQTVINPLVGELRQHRSVLSTLLQRLKLSGDDGDSPEERSAQMRSLANRRWKRDGA
ncbi:hypothetical protein SAMN04244553_3600 [Nocardia amikacinitolerans]|uniref:Terminase small subunit n=1 Tax=Nocardia amikacinitolerans TaxID=756689 RepID=A0A285LJC6_9NOCA|nr:hypothetical protein [Nocardia amikacinitolerans]SNY84147.1 hypothetical protein SAMN04244553_3600 [Nocardia amikacinitolerans]